MTELELSIGGINYIVQVDVEDNYVIGVCGVSVYNGEIYTDIVSMTGEDTEKFFETYEDQLNEAYQSHLIAAAEMAGEERWELAMDR